MPFTIHTNDLAPSTADEGVSSMILAFSPTAAVPVGKLALVLIVWDNVDGTNADDTTNLSVSDTQSNFWNRSAECQYSAGSALDGVLVGLFHSEIVTQIETTDTITISSTANGVAKGATLLTFNYDPMKTVQVIGKAYQRIAASADYSVNISGLQSEEHLWIGINGMENGPLGTNASGDTFTLITQGTLSSFGHAAGGGAAGAGARAGYKISVGNAETYARTANATVDRATLLAVFREAEAGEGDSFPTRRSMVA